MLHLRSSASLGLHLVLGILTTGFTPFSYAGDDLNLLIPSTCAAAPSLDQMNKVADPSSYRSEDFTEWFLADPAIRRGTAIVVHGINQRPSTMKDVVRDFQNKGFDVLRVALTGHRGNLEEYRSVTSTNWRQDLFFSYCLAEEHSRIIGGPIVGVGYSLGGLLIENLINEYLVTKVHLDALVLYAPAIEVHFFASWIKIFNIFGKRFIVPSVGLPEIKAYSGTPVAAYNALFDIMDEDQGLEFKRSNISTLIFADPDDELVSLSKIEDLKNENHFDRWTVVPVTNEGSQLSPKFHHMIVQEAYVGTDQWNIMTRMVADFLTP